MPTFKRDGKGNIIKRQYDLIADLNELKEPRAIVLLCHNYLEFMMDTILSVYYVGIRVGKWPVVAVDDNPHGFRGDILGSISFRRKIEILLKLKLISDGFAKKLDKANTIRNKVAHDFEYPFSPANADDYKDKSVTYYDRLSRAFSDLTQKKRIMVYEPKK